mmetsp:Transcript_7393/g.11209  ORF Transcript_7393/g.11209 Transcript_7393/m.11209 type:complete len:504 (-) Transcript_7393:200-1711(-)
MKEQKMRVYKSLSLYMSLASIMMASFVHAERDAMTNRCPLKIPATSLVDDPRQQHQKTVIAHRGASFHFPEHTLEAYRLALELGADYIEPDLCVTSDEKLIAMHTLDLNVTTNVAQVYPDRLRFSKHLNRTGYWTYEFTLDEIRQLRVKQQWGHLGVRSTEYDGLYAIPTVSDILALLKEWNTNVVPKITPKKQRAGLYAELKYPAWVEHDTDVSIVDLFLEKIFRNGDALSLIQDGECAELKHNEYLIPPLVVQSFDADHLQEMHTKWNEKMKTAFSDNLQSPPPMVLLVPKDQCHTEDFWFHVGEWKTFLSGVGPDKACLAGQSAAEVEDMKSFMDRAMEHELVVHPYTIRKELKFVSEGFQNMEEELKYLFCEVGIDGIFSENVGEAIQYASLDCSSDDKGVPASSPTSSGGTTKVPKEDEENVVIDINGTSTNVTFDKRLCYKNDEEAQMYVGAAAGIMGFLVGSIFAGWVATSRLCKTRRHTRRQLEVPTQDPDAEFV